MAAREHLLRLAAPRDARRATGAASARPSVGVALSEDGERHGARLVRAGCVLARLIRTPESTCNRAVHTRLTQDTCLTGVGAQRGATRSGRAGMRCSK